MSTEPKPKLAIGLASIGLLATATGVTLERSASGEWDVLGLLTFFAILGALIQLLRKSR